MEELKGQMATDILLPPEYLPVLQQQARDRLAGNAGVYEVPIIKKDGSLMWAMISGAPIVNYHGNVTGSIGIHYDITLQKTLYRELEESKKRAEEAQEAEKQFLANMSHEIRTPLNAIIGMAHLLMDTDPSEEQKEYLSILKNSAEMLRTLISDVLDLSKIRAGKMEAQEKEFDLVALVQTLVKSVQLRNEGKPIEVKATIDPRITHLVLGDDLLLNQILLNLLGNAEKFTSKGEIGVRTNIISELHETPMWVEFCVYDTGIGIPPEKHDLIFQTFRQVDGDTRRKFGGTGLGLAITKQLVELQGGTIRVESVLGEGTQFYVNLPYLNTGVVAENNTPIMEQMKLNSDGKRILVAEDNAMNRKYIDTLLRKWNIEHFFAHNGREAYEMCQEDHYDLVLMDIQMPEMDGYEACHAIREQPGLNNRTPIIALTASAMLSQRDKAFNAGMNDYLSKPFKPLQLFEKICLYIDSNEAIETNMPAPQEFSFDHRLDTEMLDTMYGDDLEYAFEIFEAFRDNVPNEFSSVKPLLDDEKWPELARLLHKIKPSFGMVGLSTLEKALERMEHTTKNAPDKTSLLTAYEHVRELFDNGVKIIDNDFQKLKKVNSNPS
jgi:signal transduction histidine kinase/CheY-like chemotaxis protein